ncbi:MAG: hypothetical protein E6J11_18895 [Chloroflexi bacterium]|nr:MAG: hypothetical protein E6J11_18895 [Chloroflexota bacterium]
MSRHRVASEPLKSILRGHCITSHEGGGDRVESFETYRPYLFAIASRMFGSAMDAEDMVQETYCALKRDVM